MTTGVDDPRTQKAATASLVEYLPMLAVLLAVVAFAADLAFLSSATWILWLASGLIALGTGFYFAHDRFRREAQICLLALVAVWAVASYKPGEYEVTGDSVSYLVRYDYNSVRPPVYPWFIRTAVGGIKAESWRLERIKPDDARLARVVAAQTVLYAIALAAFFCALCLILPGPFVFVIAALLLAREYHPAAGMVNIIMSETLTATFMLALATVFLLSLRHSRRGYALVGGVLFAALFLTRPAAAYGAVACAAIFAVAIMQRDRLFNREVILGAAITVALSLAPSIYVYKKTGLFLIAPNGLSLSAKAWFTAALATPADIARMPDAETKRYLEIILERRPRAYQIVENNQWVDVLPQLRWHAPIVFPAGQGKQPAWRYANMNLNQVVSPALMEVRQTNTFRTVDLISKAFWPVVKAHKDDFYRMCSESFSYAWNKVTRTRALFPWTVFFIVLFAAVVLHPSLGVVASVFLATHAMNLLVVSTNDAPIARYIYATDYFVLLAAAISVFACAKVIKAKLFGLVNGKSFA